MSQKTRQFVTLLGTDLALAYRRTGSGFGTWQARGWDGAKYHYRNLGRADDYQEADGADVLNFTQSQDEARKFYARVLRGGDEPSRRLSVRAAAEHYLAWYREHRRAYKETEHALQAHILSELGDRPLDRLSAPEIRRWLDHLASKPARIRTGKFARSQRHRAAPRTQDEKRARKATVGVPHAQGEL